MNNVLTKTGKKKLFCGNNQRLLIVADCAKSEHVIQFFESSTGQYLVKKPLRVKNHLDGFRFFQEKAQKVLLKMSLETKDVDFILEDPASYSQAFIHFLQEKGFNVFYVNALQASKYRENSRASSDTLDLDGIVRSALMGQVYPVKRINCIYSRIKECHRERNRLVREKSKHDTIIHHQIDKLFPGFLTKSLSGIQPFSKACIELMQCKGFNPQVFINPNSKRVLKFIIKSGFNHPEKVQKNLSTLASKCLNLTTLQGDIVAKQVQRLHLQLKLYNLRLECIAQEEKEMARLLQNTPYVLITSIVGAGLVTVSAIAGELGDPASWQTPDKTASYAGVIPRQKQSGGSSKAPFVGKAPKAANMHLKNALFTIVSVAKNAHHKASHSTALIHPLKSHFDRTALRDGSSYSSTAKKLIRIMYAMLRDDTIYLPDIKTTSPEDYRIWLEAGTQKLIEKWQTYGIGVTQENYLGKWLKNKEKLIALINK